MRNIINNVSVRTLPTVMVMPVGYTYKSKSFALLYMKNVVSVKKLSLFPTLNVVFPNMGTRPSGELRIKYYATLCFME
jgi:hypothetical protein